MNFDGYKKFLYPAIIGLILLLFIYREYVHYRGFNTSLENANELKTQLDLLSNIFISYHNIISMNNCPQIDISSIATAVDWAFMDGYYYTSWFVFIIQTTCCISLMVYEMRYVHPMIKPSEEKQYFMYIHKVTPISTIIFYTILLIYGSIAWCNLLDRRLYIIRCVLLLFRWHFIYNPMARWVHNTERIIRFYIMPYYDSISEFITEKCLDYNFYLWYIKKCSGVDDIQGVLNYSITTIAWFYFIYPFYYYIYYGFNNCSIAASKNTVNSDGDGAGDRAGYVVMFEHIMHIYNETTGVNGYANEYGTVDLYSDVDSHEYTDNFTSTGASGMDMDMDMGMRNQCYLTSESTSTNWIASISTDDTYTQSMEVFVNNMCMHMFVLVIFYHVCRIIGFGSPGVRIHTDWNDPNVKRANIENTDSIPASSNERIKKIISRMFSLYTSRNIQGYVVACIAANSVLVLIRILWFLRYTSCLTWYGYFVTWMFLHIHIILPLNTFNIIVLITDKIDVRTQGKRKFVDKLVEYMLLKHGPSKKDNSSNSSNIKNKNNNKSNNKATSSGTGTASGKSVECDVESEEDMELKDLEKFYQFYGSEYYEYMLDLAIRNLIFRNNPITVEVKEDFQDNDLNPALVANVEHLLNKGLNEILMNDYE